MEKVRRVISIKTIQTFPTYSLSNEKSSKSHPYAIPQFQILIQFYLELAYTHMITNTNTATKQYGNKILKN